MKAHIFKEVTPPALTRQTYSLQHGAGCEQKYRVGCMVLIILVMPKQVSLRPDMKHNTL